jgi:ATP-binding cassette, subfamily B, bacterial
MHLGRLLGYASEHRSQLVRASSYSVLNKIADLAPPVLIGVAVDIVVKRQDSLLAGFGIKDELQQLLLLAALTVIVWGLESAFEYLFQWEWRNLAQSMQHEMRLDAYKHVQQLDMAWFSDRQSGRLMSILNDDVNQLERFLDGGANSLLQVATTAVCVSAVFFYLSPAIAVLATLPIPLILWGSFYFQARIAPRYASVREKAARISGQLANNLSGIETIKSFTAEEHAVRQIEVISNDYREANRGAIKLSSAFSPLIRMVIVIGFTATLVYGGQLTLDGEMEVGAYSVLVFLTQRLLWPLTRLGESFDLYQRAMASAGRILDLLDIEPAIVGGTISLEASGIRGGIRFENIDFSYPGREMLFRGFSLEVPAGKTVAVVGPTGSGKSTLIRLLLRFHDPQKGRILLDGQEIRSLVLQDLRAAVGVVSQGVYLFDGTVAENICYGKDDATEEEIAWAGRTAEADAFISKLPGGYQSQIGERGQKLSGGQRQRISLARAVIKDPPILVLDEATSAVDNETEAAIQRSMKRISKGRTTLVIAHRLSTVQDADEIVVMDAGRIVERGSHDALLLAEGLYCRLWAVQAGSLSSKAV